MKKFIKSSTILQVVVATFVTILATAGIVVATTTISTNISTAGTLTVTDASTLTGAVTTGGALTVGTAATVTTNLTVDTNTLYVNATTNRVGVGTTTPFATLSVNPLAGERAFIIGSSTATYFEINENGDLIFGGDTNNTLYGDLSADRIGIGTTTPTATLSVETTAGDNAFMIGSTTSTYLTVNSIGDFFVDTDTLFVDNSTDRVGISSSTPMSQLSIGTGSATTSISVGRLCLSAEQDDGSTLYVWLSSGQANGAPWATSTTSCF